jgi:hypothetical protein
MVAPGLSGSILPVYRNYNLESGSLSNWFVDPIVNLAPADRVARNTRS